MTEAIVAAKMAKRCQAGAVSPSGTGQNQIAAPRTKTATLETSAFEPGVIAAARARTAGPVRVRPSMFAIRPPISPDSGETTYCQLNVNVPSRPA